jgi:hypothetical protein
MGFHSVPTPADGVWRPPFPKLIAAGSTSNVAAAKCIMRSMQAVMSTQPGKRLVVFLVSDGEGKEDKTGPTAQSILAEQFVEGATAFPGGVHLVLVALGPESAVAALSGLFNTAVGSPEIEEFIGFSKTIMQSADGEDPDLFEARVEDLLSNLLAEEVGVKVDGAPVRLSGVGTQVGHDGQYVQVVAVPEGADATVNGLSLSAIPPTFTDVQGRKLVLALGALAAVRAKIKSSLPLADAGATAALHAVCSTLYRQFLEGVAALEAETGPGPGAGSGAGAGAGSGDTAAPAPTPEPDEPSWLRERLRALRALRGDAKGADSQVTDAAREAALKAFMDNTAAFRSADVAITGTYLDRVWGPGPEALRVRRAALDAAVEELRRLDARVPTLNHRLTSAQATEALEMSSGLRNIKKRAEGASSVENGARVKAMLAGPLDPRTYEPCAASVAALRPGECSPTVDALFVTSCAGCPATGRLLGSIPNVDRLKFVIESAVPGLPISIAHALSGTPPGTLRLSTIMTGMPQTTTVTPMPGDPAALVACLPGMLSSLAGTLDMDFNAAQVAAAYPCYVLGGVEEGAAPLVREAACLALAAWLEVMRLRSEEVPFLRPSLKKLPMELHKTALTYSRAPLFDAGGAPLQGVPMKQYVPWNKVAETYVGLATLTPDAATSVMFSEDTALLVWAAVVSSDEFADSAGFITRLVLLQLVRGAMAAGPARGRPLAGAGAGVGAGVGAGAGAGAGASSGTGVGPGPDDALKTQLLLEMIAVEVAAGGKSGLPAVRFVDDPSGPVPAGLPARIGSVAEWYLSLTNGSTDLPVVTSSVTALDLDWSSTLACVREAYVTPAIARMDAILAAIRRTLPRCRSLRSAAELAGGPVGSQWALGAGPLDIRGMMVLALRGLTGVTRADYDAAKYPLDVCGLLAPIAGRVRGTLAAMDARRKQASAAPSSRGGVVSVVPYSSLSRTPEGVVRSCMILYRYGGGQGTTPFPAHWSSSLDACKAELFTTIAHLPCAATVKTNFFDDQPGRPSPITQFMVDTAMHLVLHHGMSMPRGHKCGSRVKAGFVGDRANYFM